jgi:small multidrug resistance family-3 protein
LLLFLAAVLESGGDVLMRSGLHNRTMTQRCAFFLAGGLILTAYGYKVNAPPRQFGHLLGVYVTIFLLVAQSIAWLAEKPSCSVVLGGVLIIVGGLVVSVGR